MVDTITDSQSGMVPQQPPGRLEQLMRCSECDNDLTGEEREAPHYTTGDTGTAAEVLCDDCFCESYEPWEFRCVLCENLEHIAYRDRIGDLFVVAGECTDQWGHVMQRGIYRILEHPYYGGPLLSKHYVFSGAMSYLDELPADVNTDGWPAGHCCRECAQRYCDSAIGTEALEV